MLRFTWSLKLSPHLYHFSDVEGGLFTMELLEVKRRWMWLFFRVEAEWDRHCATMDFWTEADVSLVRSNKGSQPEDILLADYNGRPDGGYVP